MSAEGGRLGFVANVSMLYTELPLLDRFAAAAEAGFQSVEAWWPYPGSAVPSPAEVDALLSAVSEAGVPLTGLNSFSGDMPGGERGIVSHPGRTAEFAANVELMVAIARRTGLRGSNALYGRRLEGVDPAEQDAVAVDNLSLAVQKLADVGVTVLVEALARGLNGAYPLELAAQVADVVGRVRERTGLDNIGFLFDTFHLAANGEDLLAVIDCYGELIAHVQLADAPGRGEPGSGSIDFGAVLQRLWESGYRGRVAAEYRPTTSTQESLAWVDGLPFLSFGTDEVDGAETRTVG